MALSNPRKVLLQAIKNKHQNVVSSLLEANEYKMLDLANSQYARGKTALHIAVEVDHLGIIEVLLKGGANPMVKDHYECFPWLNMRHPQEDKDLSEGQKLVMSHVDVKNVCPNGKPLIHFLSSIPAPLVYLKWILKAGVSVNLTDSEQGFTPLMTAISDKCMSNAILFLQQADICMDAINHEGLSAIHLAAWCDAPDMIDLLLKYGADINHKVNIPGIDIQKHWGRTSGDNILQFMLGATPLMLAIQQDYIRTVKYLLSQPDLDLEERLYTGENALMMCTDIPKSLNMFKLLTEAGANINQRLQTSYPTHWSYPYERETLLMRAVRKRRSELVEYLLKLPEIEVDVTDPEGQTALWKGVQNQDPNIIRMLLNAGANVNHRDSIGQNPTLCIRNGKVMDIMIEYGADLNIFNTNGQSLLAVLWKEKLHFYNKSKFPLNRLLRNKELHYNIDVRLSSKPDLEGNTPMSNLLKYYDIPHKNPWILPLVGIFVVLGFSLDKDIVDQMDIPPYPKALRWWKWLSEKLKYPRTLQELCRFEILAKLGHYRVDVNIAKLPLPPDLKHFLTIHGIIDWSQAKDKSPICTGLFDEKPYYNFRE